MADDSLTADDLYGEIGSMLGNRDQQVFDACQRPIIAEYDGVPFYVAQIENVGGVITLHLERQYISAEVGTA